MEKKPAKPAEAAKKAKPIMQYFREGKPITNPSVNHLAGVAYSYTKGVDGKDRISAKRLREILAELGVGDPRCEAFDVQLPGGMRISATVGALAPVPAKSPKASTPKTTPKPKPEVNASGLTPAAQAKADHIQALKDEGKAVKAWHDKGEHGPRPATPAMDKANAALQASEAKARAKADATKALAASHVAKKADKRAAKKSVPSTTKSLARKTVHPRPKRTSAPRRSRAVRKAS